jgi:hypothetical protein
MGTPYQPKLKLNKTGTTMKTIAIITGVIAVFFCIIAAIGAAGMSQARSQAYDVQRGTNAACDQMMADSALGAERRSTREMCDQLKELAAKKIRDAR